MNPKLIIVNGTMGVGKTSTCRELQKILPNNVFLDGDWCWMMHPFMVTEETKTIVLNNITYMLNQFLLCSEYKFIIFCWVIHTQSILDEILHRLHIEMCDVFLFSLVADKQTIIERLTKDIKAGLRESDVIPRSLERINSYEAMPTVKINVEDCSAIQAAQYIHQYLLHDSSSI